MILNWRYEILLLPSKIWKFGVLIFVLFLFQENYKQTDWGKETLQAVSEKLCGNWNELMKLQSHESCHLSFDFKVFILIIFFYEGQELSQMHISFNSSLPLNC